MSKTQELDNETKIQKLYEFLNLSLIEAQQGINLKLSKIIDELCNKKKSIQLLNLWMQAVNKKLMNVQTQFESEQLQSIILHQIPWFDSENHLQIFIFYEKFLLQFISSKNNKSKIQQTFQQLLRNLIPMTKFEEESRETQRIQILDIKFENKIALIQYVQKILQHKNDGLPYLTPISKTNQDFLFELFKYHPRSLSKLKDVKEIKIGEMTKFGKQSICFYLIFEDETIEDISYLKCVDSLVEKNKNISTLQNIEGLPLKVSNKIIDLLKKIINIYPLYKQLLIQTIKESFPSKSQELRVLNSFLIQILKFGHQNDNLKCQVLDIIFDKLIEIDCEIKFNKYSNENNEIYNEDYADEMAMKLDLLLFTMFEYLNFEFRPDLPNKIFGINAQTPSKQQANAKTLFDHFLHILQEKLLITFQPKYVQFIFFYLCQIQQNSNKFIEKFLTLLLNNSLYQNQSCKQISENAICYFCSFLVRAKLLDKEIIYKSINYLLKYLENYQFLDVLEKINSENVLEVKEFVSQNYFTLLSVQGILYIMCYRINIISQNQFLFQTIEKILNKINQFISISSIVDQNIKQQINKLAIQQKNQTLTKFFAKPSLFQLPLLKMYFPFDPYLLKNSEQFISQFYIQWQETKTQEKDQKNNEETTIPSQPESDNEEIDLAKVIKPEPLELVKRTWKQFSKNHEKIKSFYKKIEQFKKKKLIK